MSIESLGMGVLTNARGRYVLIIPADRIPTAAVEVRAGLIAAPRTS